MTNELCINGFSAVSEDEMMAIDGGGFWATTLGNAGWLIGTVIDLILAG